MGTSCGSCFGGVLVTSAKPPIVAAVKPLGKTPPAPDADCTHRCKIVLVGDTEVGKSNLFSRYVKGMLVETDGPTGVPDVGTRRVPMADGSLMWVEVWDPSGRQGSQNQAQVSGLCQTAKFDGALLVYDFTCQHSIMKCRLWLELVKSSSSPDVVIVLVGNKIDLIENAYEGRYNKEATSGRAEGFAKQNGLLCLEASAVTSYNVENCFEQLLQEIYNRKGQTLVIEDKPTHVTTPSTPVKGSKASLLGTLTPVPTKHAQGR